jgi:shikimate dehydrogenase
MPLKRAVLPLLDEADPLVAEAGAANTVVLADGIRSGFNTDVPGMVTALHEAGVKPEGPVLVLGGGATACSAIAALRRAGTPAVTVAVRNEATAGPLLAVAARLGVPARLVPFGPGQDRQAWLAEYGDEPWRLLLSTVPAGAADGYARLIAARELAADAVFDVVYHPWPTSLAVAARGAGMPVIGGFELLLHQAAEQVRLMTGRPAPVTAMRAAGLAELAARSHPPAGRAS